MDRNITLDQIKEYISNLQSNVGKKEKILKLLDNQELFLAYLMRIGVNPQWLDRVAIVEIARNEIAEILESPEAKITEDGITFGDNKVVVDGDVFYLRYPKDQFHGEVRRVMPYPFVLTSTHNEFVTENRKRIQNSGLPLEDLVEYDIKIPFHAQSRSLIDANGVVQFEIQNHSDNPLGGILYNDLFVARLSNSSQIEITTINSEFGIEKTKVEPDLGNPLDLRYGTPNMLSYFARYPKFKNWFDARKIDLEKVVKGIQRQQADMFEENKEEFIETKSELETNEEKIVELFKGFTPQEKQLFKESIMQIKVKSGGEDGELKLARESVLNRMRLIDEGENVSPSVKGNSVLAYDSMDALIGDAKKRIERKSVNTSALSKSTEEKKFELLTEIDRMLEEMRKSVDDIRNRKMFSNAEIWLINSAIRRIKNLTRPREEADLDDSDFLY